MDSSGLCPILAAIVLAVCAVAAHAKTPTVDEAVALFRKQASKLGPTRSVVAIPPETVRGVLIVPGETAPVMVLPPERQVNVRIVFDLDRAALRPDQRPRLAAVCTAMERMGTTRFQIIGHTDASGPDAYNEVLSVRRAEAVRAHLVDGCGIAVGRLQAVGLGERHLFDPAQPRAEVNRRVEFQALPDPGR